MATSRERVLASLDHREPDRVPVDLSGYRSSGIAAIAYPKLRAALGLPPRSVDVYDPVQQLAICHDDVLDRLGRRHHRTGARLLPGRQVVGRLDAARTARRAGCRSGRTPERADGGWEMRSPSGRVMARMPEGSVTFDQAYWPFLDGEEDLSRIEELYPEHMWTGIAVAAGAIRSETGRIGRGRPRSAREHRPGDHRPVRRQPAGDGPVLLPHGQLPDDAGRRTAARPSLS